MKLLIATQAVDANDPTLGFFVEWIRTFAAHAESVTVTALRVGAYDLPKTVRVIPLRQQGVGRVSTALAFLSVAWRMRKDYDAVFIHMNPEYALVAGWLWKLLGKKTMLWYLHRSVPLPLRLALPFVDVVASASPESFRLKTSKLRIVGHGIPTSAFGSVPSFKEVTACVTAGASRRRRDMNI